jgi:hypothetical protein
MCSEARHSGRDYLGNLQNPLGRTLSLSLQVAPGRTF